MEVTVMKYLIPALALAAIGLSVAPVSAANRCIDTRNIVSSQSKDGRTMVFKMRDGTTLVNHLQGVCTDLKYMGFVWQLHGGSNEVCERENTFRVLQSGQSCTLGSFDAPTMEKQAASKPTVWDSNRVQAPR
jgi:hypothetical protein